MLWIKAFHLISIVCWFSALFYLPRLFVYHSEASDTLSLERFKVMERKLYYYIMIPSMLLTIFFGLGLIGSHWAIYKTAGWMHAKLFLVVLLIGYHHMCGYYLKQFAQNKNRHSSRFYRIFNEIPVLFLIAIIVLAVVRPF
ncbi:MAG: protoporphyrinogen oxidase HemJ [Taibaiella sp.]|jgi:putative membrane protein